MVQIGHKIRKKLERKLCKKGYKKVCKNENCENCRSVLRQFFLFVRKNNGCDKSFFTKNLYAVYKILKKAYKIEKEIEKKIHEMKKIREIQKKILHFLYNML